MFLDPRRRRTIASLQAASITRRNTDHHAKLPLRLGPAFATCQWIYGEPRARNFCADDCKEGSAYCERHHAKCYRTDLGRLTDGEE